MNYLKFLVAFLLFTLNFPELNSQTVQGPLSPGTVVSGSCSFSYGSSLNYAPPNNITTSNNVYASALHCGCCDQNSACLRATNFGFSIPATAVITGITIEIEKRSPAGSIIEDNGLMLLKSTGEVGANLAAYGVSWPSTDTYVSYGGCNNLWGTGWTPAEINSTSFGLVFASIDYSCAGNINSLIDHIRVSVCYTTVLPIELCCLKAIVKEKEIELNWTAYKVSRNDKFDVLRSVNGSDFVNIGQIEADKFNATEKFTFTDKTMSDGMAYYQVAKYSNGGSKEIGPVSVNLISKNTFVFESASWSDDFLIITGETNSYQILKFELYDLSGKQISELSALQPGGKSCTQLPLKNITAGCYLLKISRGNEIVGLVKTYKNQN